MSKDTVSAEQFFADNKKRFWGFGPGQAVWEFADALSQHNTAALEAKLASYKEAAVDKRRLVRELDVAWNGEGAAKQASLCDIVGQIIAELSALRGKETEPATSVCPCMMVGKDGTFAHNNIVATFRNPETGATFQSCANHLEGYGDGIDGWKRIPIAQTAAPRKHTTWTEVKAEMDAQPVALPTPSISEIYDWLLEKFPAGTTLGLSAIAKLAHQQPWRLAQPVALPTPKIADLLADIEIIIVGLIDHAANQTVVISEAQRLLIRIAAFKGLGASQPVALPTEEEERKEFEQIIRAMTDWEEITKIRLEREPRAPLIYRDPAVQIRWEGWLARARRPLSLTTEKEK